MQKKQSLWAYFVERTKSNWVLFALMMAYAALALGTSVYSMCTGNVRDIFSCLVYFLIVPVFYTVERYLHIRVPMCYFLLFIAFMTVNLIGACYNLYTLFLPLDDVLHSVWGVVFMLLGFAVISSLAGEPNNKKTFFAYLIFGFAFCLMLAVFWELYEFTFDRINPNVDMQEDTVVNSFNSFLLHIPYDHLNTLQIDGIAYTILYDAQGNEIYTIEGGYLDLGVLDTMWDIIWCTVADFAACVILALDWCLGKKVVYKWFVPRVVREEVTVSPECDNTPQNVCDNEEV